MPTSPCSRCTWGHTSTSQPEFTLHPRATCGGVLFRGPAGSSPLAPCFDVHSSFFFIAGERKHKSTLISWRFFRGKGGGVSRVPEFISSARAISAKSDCCSNRNREERSKGQCASVRWFDEKELARSLVFVCTRVADDTLHTRDRCSKKKITFPLRQSNPFTRYTVTLAL